MDFPSSLLSVVFSSVVFSSVVFSSVVPLKLGTSNLAKQHDLNMKALKFSLLLTLAAALASCGPPLEGPDPLDRGDLDAGGMPLIPDASYPTSPTR